MTAETARSGHPSATALHSSSWRRELSVAAVVVIVATLVNLCLYLTGRVAGATLRLDPAVGPADHQITAPDVAWKDRKSTRLNSSHVAISYAVFCLKKKNSCPDAREYRRFHT